MPLADRSSAGRQLALLLERHRDADPIVVGLARGGVVVASEIARALGAPLELWITRRVCAPDAPDTTIGAVSEDGAVALNRDLIAELGLPHIAVAIEVVTEASKIEQAVWAMRGGPAASLRDRVVILVDDGIATGATVRAAARSIQARGPSELVLAVPVCPFDVLEELEADFDRVVCLQSLARRDELARCYRDFWEVSEAVVAGIMTEREREQLDENDAAERELELDAEWEGETTQSP